MMKPSRRSQLAMTLAALLFAGSAQAWNPFKTEPEPPKREGFSCCNLHYSDDWISDANWGAMPFIPAGTPTKVMDFGRYRVHVDMGGKAMRLGQDYGRTQETLEKFAEKLVVLEDPKKKIAQYPADIRKAIELGQVMVGMTKEQAIIAVGYPQADMTLSLDSPIWSYWIDSFASYQVHWKDGRIKDITGDPVATARMQYRKE
jgi:hypothetical protein